MDRAYRIFIVFVITFLALFLVIEVVFNLFIAPKIAITTIKVESEVPLTDREVMSLLDMRNEENYYFFADTEKFRERLEAEPSIRKAYVEKTFPDTLRLVIYKHDPVLSVYTEEDSTKALFSVDETGLIVGREELSDSLDTPVLVLPESELAVGDTLNEDLLSLVNDLKTLTLGSEDFYRLISEIKLRDWKDHDYDLELYISGFPIKVITDKRIEPSVFEQIKRLKIASDSSSLFASVKELDIRGGSIVYSEKGGEPWASMAN